MFFLIRAIRVIRGNSSLFPIFGTYYILIFVIYYRYTHFFAPFTIFRSWRFNVLNASLLIFLVIGGIGFLLLMVSLLMGDLLEAFDFDFDADFDGGDGGHFGVLDSRVISVFLTAFGGIAALGLIYGYSLLISMIMGLGSGIVFGGVIFAFGYLLYSQQSSSSVGDRDLIGRTAKVIVGIKPNSIGQISCKIGEERIEKIAKTRDGREIVRGEMVFIEENAGDSFIVSRMKGSRYPLLDE